MVVMGTHVVFRGVVTLGAHGVAGRAQLLGVRIVTVAAGDARKVHAALQPRPPDEHLVTLLAVGVIQRRLDQQRQVMIGEWRAGPVPAASCDRRAWHRAQTSISRCDVRGTLRRGRLVA